MANISSAYGTITVASRSEEDVRFIEEAIFSVTDRWEYGTHLGDIKENPIEHDENGRCSHIVDFDGEGRWTYECNVENLGRFLKEEQNSPLLPEDRLARLESLPFELTFRYTDDEPGCGVLYDKDERLSHAAGEPLENMRPETLSESYYDYDSKNLVEYAGYSNETAWDRVGETEYESRLEAIKAVIQPDGQIDWEKLPRGNSARKFLLEASTEVQMNGEAFSPENAEETNRRICRRLAGQSVPQEQIAAAVAKYSPTCHEQDKAMAYITGDSQRTEQQAATR